MKIKVTLKNGFYYQGSVLKETNTTITIRDLRGNEVTISKSEIVVKEVLEQ